MRANAHPGVLSESRPGAVIVPFSAPREEQRIVTFIDLVGSTGIAERLGAVRFHAFLSDVLARLSGVVADFGGEVHRYVGDSLIATWSLGGGKENARAVAAVFACRDALDEATAHFLRLYQVRPELRASLHSGPLVAATLGDRKGEIALIGDAMNTAARIEQACRTSGHRLLISRMLLRRVALPFDTVATSIGTRRLRGKSERIELFALERYPAGEEPICLFRACA